MAFPSTLSAFPRPNPTDRLNNPSHSALHNTVSSALGQVETVIGVEGASSVVGTLQYLIKSPASDGGGHVQTVSKGGTGQTSYTKGDILVAQSGAVLAKVAVGANTQVLQANSSMAAGIQWVNVPRKIAVSGSVIGMGGGSSAEVSIMSAGIPVSVLLSGNAIRATCYLSNVTFTDSLRINANLGGTSVAACSFIGAVADQSGYKGQIVFTVLAANDNSQRNVLNFDVQRDRNTVQASIYAANAIVSTSSSIVGGAATTIGLTAKWSSSSSGDNLTTDGYIIEQIG